MVSRIPTRHRSIEANARRRIFQSSVHGTCANLDALITDYAKSLSADLGIGLKLGQDLKLDERGVTLQSGRTRKRLAERPNRMDPRQLAFLTKGSQESARF